MNEKIMRVLLIAYGYRNIKIESIKVEFGRVVFSVSAVHSTIPDEEIYFDCIDNCQYFIHILTKHCEERNIKVQNLDWWDCPLSDMLNSESVEATYDAIQKRKKEQTEFLERAEPFHNYMSSINPCNGCADFKGAVYRDGMEPDLHNCHGSYTMTCPKLREWHKMWTNKELKNKFNI